MQARRDEVATIPNGVPDGVKLHLLIQQKKLKLSALQQKLRKQIASEAWLDRECRADALLEWGRYRRAMPDSLPRMDAPAYRFPPRKPVPQPCRPDVLSRETDRLKRLDDDYRRSLIYQQVNRVRLQQAKKLIETEKRQREDEERIFRLEQEMKNRAIQQRKAFNQEVLAGGRELRTAVANAARKRLQRNQAVKQWHNKELKQVSRLAAARLKALKDNDYETYLKLAQSTKQRRLQELMKKTDDIAVELGLKVHDQRKVIEGADETDPDGRLDAENFANSMITKEKSGRFLQGHLQYYSVVHQVKPNVREQPSNMTGGSIRSYQLDGLRFLVSLYSNKMNGILADEMGLGKTIQAIALLAFLMENGDSKGPHLVVAPKAVLLNWVREFEKWTPSINVIMYDGAPEERKLMRADIVKGSFNVLVTHYDIVIRDKNVFKKTQWEYLIVDEGHRLKNHESKLFEILRENRSKYRLLLTGTPIQNSLNELWSLLNFLLPKVFNSSDTFDDWFAAPFKGPGEDVSSQLLEEEQLLVINSLHLAICPFLLRRTKSEVEKELPNKTEQIIKCDMSAWQKAFYKSISEEATVKRDGKIQHLNNTSMHLRKACIHPYLFLEHHMYQPNDPEEVIRASGKLELLDRILPKLEATGHRVLLFSQMVKALNLIEEFLTYRNYKYLRLDGATKTDDRTQLLDAFNEENSPYFVFVLSTRAGGLGLNLQTADTVIMFDSDWNPAMDLQAEDRAHRIGQKREVLVLILVSAGTIEEVILDRASQKRSIDAKVITAGKFNEQSTHMDRQKALKEVLTQGIDVIGGHVHTPREINELISRNKEEIVLFEEMDEEYLRNHGPRRGLLTEEEIPSGVLEDNEPKEDAESPPDGGEKQGRRTRRKRAVSYMEDPLDSELSLTEGEAPQPPPRRKRRKVSDPPLDQDVDAKEQSDQPEASGRRRSEDGEPGSGTGGRRGRKKRTRRKGAQTEHEGPAEEGEQPEKRRTRLQKRSSKRRR
eukprot:evm.model.scf_544.7 EVM.evm.TU.scf_544.7   scf_544:32803-45870(+)